MNEANEPEEPDWAAMLDDELDHAEARRLWRLYVDEMATAGTLCPANGPALARLVKAQILNDRAARDCLSAGNVLLPRRGNSKAIARVNPSLTAMATLSRLAAGLEESLGLAPGTRNRVGKLKRSNPVGRAADLYLKPRGERVVPFRKGDR